MARAKPEIDLSGLRRTVSDALARPLLFIILGAGVMLVAAVLLFGGSSRSRDSEKAREQGNQLLAELSDQAAQLRQLLKVEQVQALAAEALSDPARLADLESRLAARIPEIHEARVYGPEIILEPVDSMGEQGLVALDMMLSPDSEGVSRLQVLRDDGEQWLAGATVIGDAEQPTGYLLVLLEPGFLLDRFNVSLPGAGYLALEQTVDGFAPIVLRQYGEGPPSGYLVIRDQVPGTMLRIVFPQSGDVEVLSGFQRLLIFLLGALLLSYGLIRRQISLRSKVKYRPDPDSFPLPGEGEEDDSGAGHAVLAPDPPGGPGAPAAQGEATTALAGPEAQAATGDGAEPGRGTQGHPETEPAIEPGSEPGPEPGPEPEPEPEPVREVSLPDIHYDLEQRRNRMSIGGEPVELTADIFRAYDIRGIVGKTLDAGVAYQVGRAVGSLALDEGATPVVVGRDGRHSGPELVDGLVEGMNASGCDVIDVGAVPTGALYFAAYELGSGSGVMVTGSHNPPDYNGFKVMIGGRTLSGEMITDLYRRIDEGDLRTGEGHSRGEEVLERYRERIASDIQLQRPLKVVADCGNGIGGICAADILRAIGAEVLPLFDDVDGTFPNHHPDPSEPHNLEDLIDAVGLMDADLGVAFDGDADRLGVVTPRGDIVYPDRVMMLFAREILGRKPGSTIIYDVKCTGHLDRVIAESGGQPEMWKTGHSLIKTRMKEVGAPFAGEMSGHFFFEDRWYGFDCGIYSAARLLEILAADERAPQQVLDELPNSVSTPELKVELSEGENHRFIERFQKDARFEGARVSTIDGVRADFDYGWGLVRASNTTPVLVLRFDADSEEDLERVQEAFRGQLLALKPDLELPF